MILFVVSLLGLAVLLLVLLGNEDGSIGELPNVRNGVVLGDKPPTDASRASASSQLKSGYLVSLEFTMVC
ncbi:hypothetical protein L3X38_014747 [Prunus dulcis]|uniref:Uncharacterized protein n=1 Tax=Prunus dulcis TaxID=3755 RepID=A0AAD4ZIR2_PRUDU|nr:hypothetical protein L3X38_014747 [Prunus dulcis]